MKILIVSGFLGAGKTTFIKHLAKKTKLEFTILENEYANINIDKDTLNQKELKVYEMSSGCICCSMLTDFRSTINKIKEDIDPEYLIIEPTGVGLLSSIISSISKIKDFEISILDTITLVDAVNFFETLNEFDDTFKDQIINTGNIILTKTKDVDKNTLIEITTKLRELNKEAQIILNDYRFFELEWYEKILNTNIKKELIDLKFSFTNHKNLKTYSAVDIKFKDMDDFSIFIDNIMKGSFGKVYRAKGFVEIFGYMGEFELVNKLFEMNSTSYSSKTKIVLIGNNLDENKLNIYLNIGDKNAK